MTARTVLSAIAVTSVTATLVLQPATSTAAVVVSPPNPTYTLQPLNYNLEDSVAVALGGALCDQGQCINIRHPAALGDASIQAGTDNLNTTLTTDAYTKAVVVGQSQGAQSITRWMEQYGASLPAGEEVTFVLIANPSRKTGFQSQNGFTVATPEDSGFTVIDVAREYDGWADWPDHFNVLAIINATMGMTSIHNTYEDVTNAPTTVAEVEQAAIDDPDAEQNLVWKSGGTYYVLNKTDILPIAIPLTWVGLNAAAKNLSDALRPTIDAAYDRVEQGDGITSTEQKDAPADAVAVAASETEDTGNEEPAAPTVTAVSASKKSVDTDTSSELTAAASPVDKVSDRAAKKAEREAKHAAKKAEREAKKAEREAKKAEREAKKAEREAKKAERSSGE